MINPVDNNLQSNYQVQKKVTAADNGGGQFSLQSALGKQDTEKGVIYEPSSEKQAEKNPTGAPSKKTDTFEYALDEAKEHIKDKEKEPDQITKFANELWSGISDFFVSLWRNIKKIFGNLWDSKPIGDGLENMAKPTDKISKAPSGSTNPDTLQDETGTTLSSIDSLEASRDERIRKALSDGDKDRFRSLISEEGSKAPARSTSMLTTYNAKGKINEIDPSDENKILHGDRGVRKL